MKNILLISVIIEYDSYIVLVKNDNRDYYVPFQFSCNSFDIDNTAIETKIKNETGIDVKVTEGLNKFSMNDCTIKYFKGAVLDISQISDNNKVVLLDKNLSPKVKINKFIKSNLENMGYFWDQKFALVHKNNSSGSCRFGIVKSDIDTKIKKMTNPGINIKTKRTPRLIVSLTSFPDRMYDINYTLYSLLNQSIKPDEIVLWLGVEQFPNREDDIPIDVLNMKRFGLTIKWCEDIKSFKKLIPALRDYPDDVIVTADDDLYYHKNWLKRLYKSYQKYPQHIHCHRSHQIVFKPNGQMEPSSHWRKLKTGPNVSYKNWIYGGNGVIYPPNTLSKVVFNKELFFKLCPTADDTWFWAMAVLNGTKIMIVENNLSIVLNTNLKRALGETDEFVLDKINSTNDNNQTQIHNVLGYFNLYGQIN